MASGSLILPIKPSEYVYDDGYELVDKGEKWAFGLPAEGQISSATCGAMPFRNGTGLCSPKCLRGEDWVFMNEWAEDRFRLPDSWYIFTDWNSWAYEDVVEDGPTLGQLTAMYNNLSALKPVYGSGFNFQNQECTQNGYRSILKSCLVSIGNLDSQPPPTTGDVSLDGNRIATFFSDMQKFKCTIARAYPYWKDRSGYGYDYLYWWSKSGQQEPSELEYHLSGLAVGYSPPQPKTGNRPMEIEARFIGQFKAHTAMDNDGQWSYQTKYCLYDLGTATLVQDLDSSTSSGKRFTYQVNIGGAGFAGTIAQFLGMSIHPSASDSSSFQLDITGLWAVVWPKYLTY